LRWSAVALASPIVLHGDFLSRIAAASSQRDDVSPANLELVTLTEDRAVITWYTGYTGTDDGLGRMRPAPTHAEVHWGTNPRRLNRVAGGASDETPYHYVELTGLEPGRTYYYEARSNGKPVPPTQFTLISGNAVGTSDFGLGTGGPYSFTAPEPPPGRFLFSIALCNDLHMGETEAGRVGGTQITGVEQVPGRPPYPEVMLESLVHDAGKLGADYLLTAGDISAEAVPVELSKALALLKKFGRYRRDYFVARGNHDRAHDGDAYAACSVGQWQGNDCFHDQFFPGGESTYFTRELRGLRVVGIDTYDKPGRETTPVHSRPTSSRGSGPSSPRTGTSRRSCSATIRSWSRARRSPSRRAARSTQRRRRPSWTTTPTLPDCSCITPGTPTATSAPSAPSRLTSSIKRSPRARSIPAASRSSGCTRVATR
jgi:Purple acid Phosphatase, N-terminal domain/Calcineurin-like phosphoesterase